MTIRATLILAALTAGIGAMVCLGVTSATVATAKYELWINAPHEAIVSIGLAADTRASPSRVEFWIQRWRTS